MDVSPFDPFATSPAALSGAYWLDSVVHNRATCGWCRPGWAAAQPAGPTPDGTLPPGALALGWSPTRSNEVFGGHPSPGSFGPVENPFEWSSWGYLCRQFPRFEEPVLAPPG